MKWKTILEKTVRNILTIRRLTKKNKSIFFEKIKENAFVLTQGYNLHKLDKILEDSTVFTNYWSDSYTLVEVKFPNDIHIFIYMTKYLQERIHIANMYMNNFSSIYTLIDPKGKYLSLKLPGIVTDPDGFVYIRKSASANSPIVGTLHVGEHFEFRPNKTTKWWQIIKSDSQLTLGFVYSDRITQYKN